MPQLREFNYDDRLKKLGLTRLVDRRIRGDMIETYKILSGKEKVNPIKFFKPASFIGRSHSRKIFRKYSRLNKRKYWFSQRIIPKWNVLSTKEVEAVSTSVFKTEYDINEAKRMEIRRNDIYIRE